MSGARSVPGYAPAIKVAHAEGIGLDEVYAQLVDGLRGARGYRSGGQSREEIPPSAFTVPPLRLPQRARAATEVELSQLARDGFISWNGIILKRDDDFDVLCPFASALRHDRDPFRPTTKDMVIIEGLFGGDNSTEYPLNGDGWVEDHLELRPVIRKNCVIFEESTIYGPNGVPSWISFLVGPLKTESHSVESIVPAHAIMESAVKATFNINESAAIERHSVPSEKGGRPTDKKLVIAKAEQDIKDRVSLPSSLEEWARRIRKWLDKRPDAVRTKKTAEVMTQGTIEGHIRPLWTKYQKAVQP